MPLSVATPWVFTTPTRRRQVSRVAVVAAPSGDVVTLAEAKSHLRVTHGAEDALIQTAINVAVEELDGPHGWLGRSLLSRQLVLILDEPPPFTVWLPGPPVTAIDAVEYRRRSDGTLVTVDAADYQSDLRDAGRPAKLWPSTALKRWPTDVIEDEPDAFRVTYTAGYASAAAVPDRVKQWIKVRVGELYRDREGTTLNVVPTKLPHVRDMLTNLRVR